MFTCSQVGNLSATGTTAVSSQPRCPVTRSASSDGPASSVSVLVAISSSWRRRRASSLRSSVSGEAEDWGCSPGQQCPRTEESANELSPGRTCSVPAVLVTCELADAQPCADRLAVLDRGELMLESQRRLY